MGRKGIIDDCRTFNHVHIGGTPSSAFGVAGLLKGGEPLNHPPGGQIVRGGDSPYHGTCGADNAVMRIHVKNMGVLVGTNTAQPVVVVGEG